jgi:hypothetical protein
VSSIIRGKYYDGTRNFKGNNIKAHKTHVWTVSSIITWTQRKFAFCYTFGDAVKSHSTLYHYHTTTIHGRDANCVQIEAQFER